METNLVFTGDDLSDNWFYNKYYYSGDNTRYHTFQLVLNLLHQRYENPVIVETGCQRLKDDLGGGMSTAIWAEYIERYGGKLISVDISLDSLKAARSVLKDFEGIDATLVHSDSVEYLRDYQGPCSLLYLDSFDYPYGELLNLYGGQEDIEAAIEIVKKLSREEILEKHASIILPCQEHCLAEFKAVENRLDENCILLVDDNLLAGGGKPRLLKDHLWETKKWICLLDFQGSIWVRKIL